MCPLYIKFIGNNQNAKLRIAEQFKQIYHDTTILGQDLATIQNKIFENVICKPLETKNAYEWQKELLTKYKKDMLSDASSSVFLNIFPLEEISFYDTLFAVHNYMDSKQTTDLDRNEQETFELVENFYFKKCKVIYIYILDPLNPFITTDKPENVLKFQMKQNLHSLIYHHKKTKRFKNKHCMNNNQKGYDLYYSLKKHGLKCENYNLFGSKNKICTFDKWN